MRIPHHLSRAPSGLWSFRQRVPTDLQPCLGRRVIKRTLRTNTLTEARAKALALAARYAWAFVLIRGNGMDKKQADALIESVQGEPKRDWSIERDPQGSIRIQADPGPDTEAALATLDKIGVLNPSFFAPPPTVAAPTVAVPVASKLKHITMERAARNYLLSIEADTLPKTLTIKRSALEGFAKSTGTMRPLPSVTRTDIAQWIQTLRNDGLATPTIVNKASYLRTFFTWAMGAGYYEMGDNPAQGQVRYGANDKRKRRKLGFRAFNLEQVQALFEPTAFQSLSSSARWAALIGLYTGARASEVGQLRLTDIADFGGLPCISINDEGEHQKLKTESSTRVVPIHADLIALGFVEHVKSLREAGEQRLFSQSKADAVNGAGNWISKAFSRHLGTTGKDWEKAKRGFHSLRKTFIQELQGKGAASEMRAQICGHELDDEHHGVYSREFTPTEKLNGVKSTEIQSAGLKVLDYGLNLEALSLLLKPSKEKSK